MQRLQADLQDLGRPRLVVISLGKRTQDDAALDLVEREADWQLDRIAVDRRGGLGAREAGRQVAGLDLLGLADDDGTVDGVAQLAHVAWPRVLHPEAHGLRA